MHSGDKVHLRRSDGKYVSHHNGGLSVSNVADGESTFTLVIPDARGRLTAKDDEPEINHFTQFRLRIPRSDRVICTRPGEAELSVAASGSDGCNFIAELLPEPESRVRSVALRTYDGTHFLRAIHGGGGGVDARSTSPCGDETFALILRPGDDNFVNGAHVYLQSSTGHFVSVSGSDEGQVHATATRPGPNETFRLRTADDSGGTVTYGARIGLETTTITATDPDTGERRAALLSAENGGGDAALARSSWFRRWEKFTLVRPLPQETLPELDSQRVVELGERRLAELIEDERQGEFKVHVAGHPHRPRVRRRARTRTDIVHEQIARRLYSPRYALGRLMARKRLINWDWKVIVPTVLVAVSFWGSLTGKIDLAAFPYNVLLGILGLSVAGALAFLSDELIRCPLRAWRLRRNIRRAPISVLPSAPIQQDRRRLIPTDDPLEGHLIPREDLCDDVVPGLLQRQGHDVQVIVGEPGSGKTTALVYLAGMLAKIGLVPVLVPLRNQPGDNIEAAAKSALGRQLGTRRYSDSQIDAVWRWLRRRNRLVVLTDDIDQIGADGDRNLTLRRSLEEVARRDIPMLVTARPAGIPAGIAASSIELGSLEEEGVLSFVRHAAKSDPGVHEGFAIADDELLYWVRQGGLTEAPFYLELLAALYAAGRCPQLPAASVLAGERRSPRVRRREDGTWEWDPQWVRFRLLERFYTETSSGHIRRWLGIESPERVAAMRELENAALGMLRASAKSATARAESAETQRERPDDARAAVQKPARHLLQDFLNSGGLSRCDGMRKRTVTAHEVIDAGERLRLLDYDQYGHLQFRHRIMHAYLAGRRLIDLDQDRANAAPAQLRERLHGSIRNLIDERLDDLTDRHNPEKLTAQMTLTFAAMGAYDRADADEENDFIRIRILERLLDRAECALPDHENHSTGLPDSSTARIGISVGEFEAIAVSVPVGWVTAELSDRGTALQKPSSSDDPAALSPDPERRPDADVALMLLTTAAHIARTTPADSYCDRIVNGVRRATGATRWTKLDAITAVSRLTGCAERWERIWEYARDFDYLVRRAASDAIQASAADAYEALRAPIRDLILRAAARSALSQPLASAMPGSPDRHCDQRLDIAAWHDEDVLALHALGWILPAIVSGLREESALDWQFVADETRHSAYVRDARRALEWLVALAFEGGHDDFEASVAQGFKDDAMRHAEDPGHRVNGPGWVASNRQLVADICLVRAEAWYSRMLLHQALALYGIVGAEPEHTLELIDWYLHSSRERHPFVREAAALARRAVRRKLSHSSLWTGLIWRDEREVVSRRATRLDDCAAQLAGDVTLLLNLSHARGEDRQAQLRHLHALPYCLEGSHDRIEILGAGCPATCGCGLCPHKEPAPDQPSSHRAVSRAFCRQQQQIAGRHKRGRWQHEIRFSKLEEFWQQMERRART